MTDTNTAGLEKRLRMRALAYRLRERSGDTEVLLTQAADALAKARVALEAAEWDGPCEDWSICPTCHERPHEGHKPTCPIGAALEAMK